MSIASALYSSRLLAAADRTPADAFPRATGIAWWRWSWPVASGRFPGDKPTEDFGNLSPDLAIEVLSPHDRPRYVLDRIGEYLEAGVRLVWVIDPRKQRAIVYRSLSEVRELGPDDELDGEDVLPGFRCPLRSILT